MDLLKLAGGGGTERRAPICVSPPSVPLLEQLGQYVADPYLIP